MSESKYLADKLQAFACSNIAMAGYHAGYMLGLSRHFGAELSMWGLRGSHAGSRLHIRLHYKGARDMRESSSCMIVGSSISYHSLKQCRILRENLNKFPAKAIDLVPMRINFDWYFICTYEEIGYINHFDPFMVVTVANSVHTLCQCISNMETKVSSIR